MSKMLVPILLGGESDREWAKKITDELDKWGIPHKVQVCSAHKVPELLIEIIREYNQFDGELCYVTIAGRSNGLSGCTAGSSIHPVIACPPFKDKDDMMVNVNSTLQMPSETPVLTVLDPNNVANCIVRMFALSNPDLKARYEDHIKNVKSKYKKV
ncbi:AIR carboxylase family protein [Candidatus Peregrinibacteria bacterium]|nr:AIR carboxylase family protein [Candidatus Peregrinibacteria bacterium]